MKLSRKNLVAVAHLIAIAWVNYYVVREMFNRDYTGHMNSMHGAWTALARVQVGQWFRPTWWPFWYGGMPWEYTYSPLVPGLSAVVARITGASASHGYHFVSGFMYCLGPVTLFIMAWRLTGAAGYSFATALFYSLLAPTELLLPETRFHWADIFREWRLNLTVSWDETPHLTALAFLPLIILFLYRSITDRRPRDYLLAGLFLGLALLANPYGGTMTALAGFCLLFSLGKERWLQNTGIVIAIGAVTYLVVCPFYPPSLLAVIRESSAQYDPWNLGSITGLSVLIFAWSLLWWATRGRMKDPFLRFVLYFALLTSAIPSLVLLSHRVIMPQPERYKIEMEFALALAAVFGARVLIRKAPRPVRIALALLLLSFAVEQVVVLRQFGKRVIWAVDITGKMEYRVSKWLEQNLPGRRVLLPGSIAQWANAFTDQPQLSGGSYPTAPNPSEPMAVTQIFTGWNAGPRDVPVSLAWLKAFGVGAVVSSGTHSKEFWKPFTNPNKFDGVLESLWSEDEITVYKVPQRSASLAHVVDARALVQHPPRTGLDVAEIERYTAALDDANTPEAAMQWDGFNRIRIHTRTRPGEVVSVQVNQHPGWHARVNGARAPIERDGLGLMFVQPAAAGPAEIELRYDGGWEALLCRIVSALALFFVAWYAWRTCFAPIMRIGGNTRI